MALPMDPQTLHDTLVKLDDKTLVHLIAKVLDSVPHLAPSLVHFVCPELSYAPVKALTRRRLTGVVSRAGAQGVCLKCPELGELFGCDAMVHRNQLGTLALGTRVSFAVLLTDDNRPQAFELLSLDGAAYGAVGGAGPPGAASRASRAPRPPRARSPQHAGGGPELAGGAASGDGDSGPPAGGHEASKAAAADAAQVATAEGDGGAVSPRPPPPPPLRVGGAPPGGGSGPGDEVLGEFMGLVRSVEEDKGFGFIMSSQMKAMGINEDAYVHKFWLGDGRFGAGAEVAFTAFLDARSGRVRAKDVRDATGQVGPQQAAPQFGQKHVVLGTYLGVIKNYNAQKGFGFICCQALKDEGHGGDVYLHAKHAQSLPYGVGDTVSFTAYLHQGRLQGRDVGDPSAALAPLAKRPRAGGAGGPAADGGGPAGEPRSAGTMGAVLGATGMGGPMGGYMAGLG